MIRKLLILSIVALAFIFGRDTAVEKNSYSSLQSIQNSQTVNINKIDQRVETSRETVILYEWDFEGDLSDWSSEGWWETTEVEYNSPTHSYNSPNPPNGENVGSWALYSPEVSLPDVGEGEVIRFGFSLFEDQVDSDGDGDNFLEDYYRISLADVDALAWHTSSFNAYSGDSYWCGYEEYNGYLDGWLQFLDSPVLTIPSTGTTLSAQMKWGLEDPAGAGGVSGHFIDGWDAANVRISADGGATWDILEGSDPYDFTSGYGWAYNGEPDYIPGWGGQQDWHNVTFNLDAYAGQDVIIRFAFGSDPAYSVIDDPLLIGLFVDDISVTDAGGAEIFSSNADDVDLMAPTGLVWVDQFYDYSGDDSDPRPGHYGWEEYL
ncbi:MAG: hypothetical protein ACE5D7_06695, partial [Fidelibacterota bacterium]